MDHKNKGTRTMYRERQQYPALPGETGDWQDWPASTSSTDDAAAGVALRPAKSTEASIAKVYRQPVEPAPMPQDRGRMPSLPPALTKNAAPRDPKRSRRMRKLALSLGGVLLVLAGGGWYGDYWWTTG